VPLEQTNPQAENRVRTGIRGLDDVLGGGLDPDRLYLIEGEPGTGKTTLALQFLLEGIRFGERGLYVTLSESEEELRLVAARHGWSVGDLSIFELVPPEASLDPEREQTLFHPAEMELAETMAMIFDRVDDIAPTRVVFDSLSEMRLLAQNPLRYRRQILALKHFFAGRKTTVLLLDDLSAHGSDMHLHSIANGVVLLEQLSLDYGAERRRLRVKKMRGIAFRGGYHDFTIETGGLLVFPRLVASEHHKAFLGELTSSGSAELDALLGGGLERGTSTLLIGGAGVGKSSIAVTYAVAAANRGEHVAIFAFDEGLGTLFARATSLGVPLQKHVDEGHVTVQQIDPAEMSPGEFTQLVRDAVEKSGARALIIDSLNGYLNACRTSASSCCRCTSS
jgi:circadian clock protein KaiC